jgi:hypothetical protein
LNPLGNYYTIIKRLGLFLRCLSIKLYTRVVMSIRPEVWIDTFHSSSQDSWSCAIESHSGS